MDVNTLIGLGILGIVGFLAKAVLSIREDTREIKTVLGINGHARQGLVSEVDRLRERTHQHANDLTVLRGDVQELKARP